MGHEGYLSSAYLRLDDDELKKEYLKGMSYINIFEHKQDLSGLNESMKDKDSRIIQLENEMALLKLNLHGVLNKFEIEKMKNGKK